MLRSISCICGWHGAINGLSVGEWGSNVYFLPFSSVACSKLPVLVPWNAAAWVSFGHHTWHLTEAFNTNGRSPHRCILANLAVENTFLRLLHVGRVCRIGIADTFSAFLYCWKLPHFPQIISNSNAQGTLREVNGWLWAQSSRRTLVLWDSHPEASEHCWCLERLSWCVLLCWVSKIYWRSFWRQRVHIRLLSNLNHKNQDFSISRKLKEGDEI